MYHVDPDALLLQSSRDGEIQANLLLKAVYRPVTWVIVSCKFPTANGLHGAKLTLRLRARAPQPCRRLHADRSSPRAHCIFRHTDGGSLLRLPSMRRSLRWAIDADRFVCFCQVSIVDTGLIPAKGCMVDVAARRSHISSASHAPAPHVYCRSLPQS